MFDRQPTLQCGAYSLMPLVQDDRSALGAAARDPLIWAGHPEQDRYKPAVFDRLFDTLIGYGGALVLRYNDDVIGTSTYYTGSTQPGTIAIGYTFLTRAHWGGATNRIMKAMMLDHAFQNFDAVWLHIAPSNIRSQKATQRLGAVYSHTEDMQTSLGPCPMQFYVIEKSAWRDRVSE